MGLHLIVYISCKKTVEQIRGDSFRKLKGSSKDNDYLTNLGMLFKIIYTFVLLHTPYLTKEKGKGTLHYEKKTKHLRMVSFCEV